MRYSPSSSEEKRSSPSLIRHSWADVVPFGTQIIDWFRTQMRRASKVMSYGVLTIIYFVVITPIAVLLRICGRDPLRLKPPSENGTTWFASDSRIGQCGPEQF